MAHGNLVPAFHGSTAQYAQATSISSSSRIAFRLGLSWRTILSPLGKLSTPSHRSIDSCVPIAQRHRMARTGTVTFTWTNRAVAKKSPQQTRDD